MAIKQKRLGGLSKIHYAKITGVGAYDTPKPLTGAKSIEVSLNYESKQFYADNGIDYSDFIFSGGEGTLTLSGLTTEEYVELFGATKDENGVVGFKSTDVSPEFALLFERKVLGTQNDTVKYVVYACKFAPVNISAVTMEGTVEEEPIELTFTVREADNNYVYKIINTTDEDATEAAASWYEAVYVG